MGGLPSSFTGDIGLPDDFEVIARLHTQSWQRFYREIYSATYLDTRAAVDHHKKWDERFRPLKESGDFIRIARENGRPIGFTYALAKIVPDRGILMDQLHIAPLYQRRGVGQALMAEVAQWVASKDVPLYLEVFAANKDAITFYERRGGQKIEEFTEDLPDGSKALTLIYQWRKPRIPIPREKVRDKNVPLNHHSDIFQLEQKFHRALRGAGLDERRNAGFAASRSICGISIHVHRLFPPRGIIDRPVNAHGVAGPGRAIGPRFFGQGNDDVDGNDMRRGKEFTPVFRVQPLRRDAFGFHKRDGFGVGIRQGPETRAAGIKAQAALMAQQTLCQKAARGVAGRKKKDHKRPGIHHFFISQNKQGRITYPSLLKRPRVTAQSLTFRISMQVAQKTHLG